jgi:hypothetical protein
MEEEDTFGELQIKMMGIKMEKKLDKKSTEWENFDKKVNDSV